MADPKPPEPISDAELDAMQARAKAATAGPWVAVQSSDRAHLDWIAAEYQSGEKDHVALIGGAQIAEVGRSELDQQNDDSDFIAHARLDVPRLVAEVRALRAVVENICDNSGWGERGVPLTEELFNNARSLLPAAKETP